MAGEAHSYLDLHCLLLTGTTPVLPGQLCSHVAMVLDIGVAAGHGVHVWLSWDICWAGLLCVASLHIVVKRLLC